MSVQPLVPFEIWIGLALVATVGIFVWYVVANKRKTVNISWWVSALAIVALLGAILNPTITSTEIVVAQNDDSGDSIESVYDIYLVVDTTSSIAAEDWNGGVPRLQGVKDDILSILDQYPNARYSLIAFDSVATTKVPITNDVSAVTSTVAALQQEVTGNSRGSSISVANELLLESLSKNANADRRSVVFFFSDGEQTSNEPVESFAASSEYISSGLVLGYGTAEGGRMRVRIGYAEISDNYIKDSAGNDGVSIIDEANLKAIANELGVNYVRRSANQPLNVAPDQEGSAIGDITAKQFSTIGLYWVFALAVFLLLSAALAHTARNIQKYSKSSKAVK